MAGTPRRIPMEATALAFKARLRHLIADSGLNYAELAERCGLSASTIGDWANDKLPQTPNVVGLAKLATYFDVATDYLLGKVDSRHGLPASYWLVDLDYVDAVTNGDRSVLDDPDQHPAVPIPRRAKLMSSNDYEKLKRRMRKERGA